MHNRSRLESTVDSTTLTVIHRIMKEQKCNKSRAIDYLAKYYTENESIRHKSDILAEEIATKIVEKQMEIFRINFLYLPYTPLTCMSEPKEKKQ